MRIKIPVEVESEVLFLSNRLCCIDQKRGDHIHHIDGNPQNNRLDNLAFLCFDCHNEASISRSLRKQLTPKAIIKFRNHHYNLIKSQRLSALKILSNPVQHLSSENLINASLSAQIILKIIEIKHDYFNDVHLHREHIISKILAYSDCCDNRVSYEVFSFLGMISYEVKTSYQNEMAGTIHLIVNSFFPPVIGDINTKQIIALGKQCLEIGSTLFYNSTIHKKSLYTASYGLMIIKFIYLESKRRKISVLQKLVLSTFEELLAQMQRPERSDLSLAKELLALYKNDLSSPSQMSIGNDLLEKQIILDKGL